MEQDPEGNVFCVLNAPILVAQRQAASTQDPETRR